MLVRQTTAHTRVGNRKPETGNPPSASSWPRRRRRIRRCAATRPSSTLGNRSSFVLFFVSFFSQSSDRVVGVDSCGGRRRPQGRGAGGRGVGVDRYLTVRRNFRGFIFGKTLNTSVYCVTLLSYSHSLHHFYYTHVNHVFNGSEGNSHS